MRRSGGLVDVGDAAAGVDAGAASTPCEEKCDDVDEEPEADAQVVVDPEENEQARDEQSDDGGDDADDGRDVLRHAVLKPREDDADAREEEGEYEEPQRNGVRCQIEMDVHWCWLLCRGVLQLSSHVWMLFDGKSEAGFCC